MSIAKSLAKKICVSVARVPVDSLKVLFAPKSAYEQEEDSDFSGSDFVAVIFSASAYLSFAVNFEKGRTVSSLFGVHWRIPALNFFGQFATSTLIVLMLTAVFWIIAPRRNNDNGKYRNYAAVKFFAAFISVFAFGLIVIEAAVREGLMIRTFLDPIFMGSIVLILIASSKMIINYTQHSGIGAVFSLINVFLTIIIIFSSVTLAVPLQSTISNYAKIFQKQHGILLLSGKSETFEYLDRHFSEVRNIDARDWLEDLPNWSFLDEYEIPYGYVIIDTTWDTFSGLPHRGSPDSCDLVKIINETSGGSQKAILFGVGVCPVQYGRAGQVCPQYDGLYKGWLDNLMRQNLAGRFQDQMRQCRSSEGCANMCLGYVVESFRLLDSIE